MWWNRNGETRRIGSETEEEREKGPRTVFGLGNTLIEGGGWRACLRHLTTWFTHTLTGHKGAFARRRRCGAADAAAACEVNDSSERSLSLIGRGRHLPRCSNHFLTSFVATLATDQKRSLRELFDSIALLTHRWTVRLKTGC